MKDFSGTWKNQNDSKLELSVSAGAVTGRFESGVGDDGHVVWVTVAGRQTGDVIAFSAAYDQFGTAVSWVGQIADEDGTEAMLTHWLHVSDIPDNQEPKWLWYTNRIGNDRFTRM